MSLNYDIVEAVPVTLVYDRVHFWIVGCGGTGSFLVGLIVRIALELIRSGKPTKITLVDPDRVEAKNTIRQCFCSAEIGRNKAQTLAMRYSLAHKLEIEAIPSAFGPQWIAYQSSWGDRANTLTILMGCVDRASGRRSLHQALDRNRYRSQKCVWWIDAGNGDRHGQVLVGSSLSVDPNDYRLTKIITYQKTLAVYQENAIECESTTFTKGYDGIELLSAEYLRALFTNYEYFYL